MTFNEIKTRTKQKEEEESFGAPKIETKKKTKMTKRVWVNESEMKKRFWNEMLNGNGYMEYMGVHMQ